MIGLVYQSTHFSGNPGISEGARIILDNNINISYISFYLPIFYCFVLTDCKY